MSGIIVVFHNPDDDRVGKLNECLRNKNALVSRENEVAAVKFPDGWLIVCYDDEPSEQMKQVIEEKIHSLQPQYQSLVVHESSWDADPSLKRAQHSLTSKGNVLDGAGRAKFYSHELEDQIYKGLIDILSHSHLKDLGTALAASDKKSLSGDFSKLKHQIGRILSAIDIDLQGIVESGFNPEYKLEIVEAYQAEKKTQAIASDKQNSGATYAGPRAQVTTTGTALSGPGKATGALEKVRQIVHTAPKNIKGLKEEALQLIDKKTEQGQQVESAWAELEKLLPVSSSKPDSIYSILQQMETEKGLEQLQAQFDHVNAWDKIFHQWFYSLDEALNKLRDTMTKPLGKSSGTQQPDSGK